MPSRRGFVFVELIIIAVILGILSLAAVPRFMESRQRSFVSRTKADMRSLAVALEAYQLAEGGYPNCHRYHVSLSYPLDPPGNGILERLSTPVAYISDMSVRDAFPVRFRLSAANAQGMDLTVPIVAGASDPVGAVNCLTYQSWNSVQRYTSPPDGFSNPALNRSSTAWVLQSTGPDSTYYLLSGVLANDSLNQLPYTSHMIYDPTNGTASRGSIFRAGGLAPPSPSYKAGEGLVAAIQSGW